MCLLNVIDVPSIIIIECTKIYLNKDIFCILYKIGISIYEEIATTRCDMCGYMILRENNFGFFIF